MSDKTPAATAQALAAGVRPGVRPGAGPGAAKGAFFIGWEAQSPAIDRRTLLALATGLVATGAGAGYGLARAQDGPGAGSWDMANERVFSGHVAVDPYPRLISGDVDTGGALLVCPTKCGVQRRVESLHGAPAQITGTLLARGRHRMIAVSDADGAIAADDAGLRIDIAASGQDLGEVVLPGEILDSKCWFGAMRPGQGKPHKACAALCVRFGIPPALYVKDAGGAEHAFVMVRPDGASIGPDVLDLIADPVTVSGRLVAVAEGVRLIVDPSAIIRA